MSPRFFRGLKYEIKASAITIGRKIERIKPLENLDEFEIPELNIGGLSPIFTSLQFTRECIRKDHANYLHQTELIKPTICLLTDGDSTDSCFLRDNNVVKKDKELEVSLIVFACGFNINWKKITTISPHFFSGSQISADQLREALNLRTN